MISCGACVPATRPAAVGRPEDAHHWGVPEDHFSAPMCRPHSRRLLRSVHWRPRPWVLLYVVLHLPLWDPGVGPCCGAGSPTDPCHSPCRAPFLCPVRVYTRHLSVSLYFKAAFDTKNSQYSVLNGVIVGVGGTLSSAGGGWLADKTAVRFGQQVRPAVTFCARVDSHRNLLAPLCPLHIRTVAG